MRPGRAPTKLPEEWRLFRAANRVADTLGICRAPLGTAELLVSAQKQMGLLDFGEDGFEDPFEVLLKSLEEEADLCPFGRLAVRWDTLRFLMNLLELQEVERITPGILAEPIERPIFITGMPRSGTTFLHEVLAEDEANAVVRCWETIYPGPSDNSERKRKAVARHLAGFARIAPRLCTVHHITADSPQECTEITAHVFVSYRFDTTYHVPSYRKWVDRIGLISAYRFHKRFLQHLQYRNGRRRWILKCPDHVFALPAIRAVYPDAFFVFLHRNPVSVMPSVARLTEILRRPFTRSVDCRGIGQQVFERWIEGAAIMTAEREACPGGSDAAWHLGFDALVRDPQRCVDELYDRCGRILGVSRRARVSARIASTASRPEPDKARLEDYGLDAQLIRERYRDYIRRFEL
jgi:hypothetical protein